ncbi:ThiF family adenylyltransferase [Wukongibacter sp. M2B1]|uniref:ThiF family adenylyltransferase n=1 Tax=Wukongibacter sp. M2B1 TaxID=3088895 RepID=UPI003D796503
MMDVQLSSIKEYLEEAGYECVYVANPNGDYLFIDIYIKEEVIRLKCTFPSGFPYEFPKVYILQVFYKKYAPLPHVNSQGSICTFDINKVFPNNDKPNELTLETVKQAETILIDGIEGRNKDEFRDEFLAYWQLESNVIADLIFTPTDKLERLFYYKRNKSFIYLSNDKKKLSNYLKYAKGWKISSSEFKKALFLPMLNKWYPPFANTNKEVIDLLSQEKYYNEFLSYMKDNTSNRMIISSHEVNDSLCICGWEHKKEKTPNGFRVNSVDPILMYKHIYGNTKIMKITVNQLGHRRLYDRGGDGTIKEDIKVSIIGCGSIGSYLTKTLVDLGINNFTLIDNDELSAENIARHYCGVSYIRNKKVDAIKEELIRHYPDINCTAVAKNVFTVIDDSIEIFNSCDLNFVVVGSMPVERKFITLLNEGNITKPIVFIWVEPYLMGGHAIIMQHKQDISTLYDCNFNFKNRVILNGEEYIKKEAGCQSTFLPYSAFEVQLFINAIIDYINKKIIEKKDKGNYLLSWSGRVDKARRSDMKINSRWMSSKGRELRVLRLEKNEKV